MVGFFNSPPVSGNPIATRRRSSPVTPFTGCNRVVVGVRVTECRDYFVWRLGSVGPDQTFYNHGSGLYSASKVYDPTNGTISIGNIWRSQREADVSARPPFDEVLDP